MNMSMKDLNKNLEKVLNRKTSQTQIIKELDEIFEEFGIRKVNSWRNLSNRTQNTLLHELVEKDYLDVVRYVISKYNLRTFFKRESDGMTPLGLARLNENWKMSDLLIEFGDDKTITETYDKFASKIQKDKTMNIVWIDLEFTSFQDPQILECAVIITDKDLNEIERNQWVVHFDQEVIDGLGTWHQDAFKDIELGGNGLFKDILASQITKQQMEDELLELLKRHCPEKACPLAGSSIHVDKEVMKVQMPSVHNFLHYRVIDVSSFREMMKRWAPKTASNFARQLVSDGREIVSHRAMDDIEWSMEMMKLFRPLLTSRQIPKGTKTKDELRCHSDSPRRRNVALPKLLSPIDSSKLRDDEKQILKRIEFEQDFDVTTLQLTNDEQRIYDQNPHLREVFCHNEQLISSTQNFNDENRQLPRLSLNRSISTNINHRETNTTEYWEQRKILLSEIEFLTKFSTENNCLVIYAGGAPGVHINYLSSLFPQSKFHLIDEENFLANENEQIEIKSSNFTDQLAEEYSRTNEKILFICNIQTLKDEDEDMANQIKWHQIIQPIASLFKFRCSSKQKIIPFFQGQFLLDLWSSNQSDECRLIVEKDASIIEYNPTDIQRGLRHFHNTTRTIYYEYDFENIQTEGIDHCYDCRAEIYILQKYFIQIKQINDEKQLKQAIARLSYEISRNLHEKHRQPFINTIRTLNIIPKI